MPEDAEKLYYVTQTLKDQQDNIAELFRIHHACSKSVGVDIATLKIKAGLWGALAGAVPSLVALGILLYKGIV